MEPFQILCSVAAIIIALYYFYTSTFDFWKARGIRGPRPIPGFGTYKKVILGKISLGGYVTKIYNEYKDEPLIGLFSARTPILIVKDPDLIKDVLIKDFPIFADRGYTTHEKGDPLIAQNIFFLKPKRWRPLRAKLTPIFTSRKLKEMFSLISGCADNFVDYIGKLASKNDPIECFELMNKYTIDAIGNCAFGIEKNTLTIEDSEFLRIIDIVRHPPWKVLLRNKIKIFSLWLYNIISHILPHTEVLNFFMSLITDNMNYREKNNIVRHDFIDILRDLKKNSEKMGDIDFTDSFMASQAFAFIIAGLESSSKTISNTLYEIALNQKLQDKLREEIEEYTKRSDNLTYDNIKEMKYMDKIFKETLRKYPALMFLMRKSTSSYTFNGTKVTIPKGQKILIPVHALHNDPRIYSEPDVYDPERFNENAVQSRHPMFFLPFGHGPRNCIGYRFAIYVVKLGLIRILQNYKVVPCKKTEMSYAYSKENFTTSKNGLYLKLIKINQH